MCPSVCFPDFSRVHGKVHGGQVNRVVMGQPVIVITDYVSCLRKGMHKLRTVLSRAGRTIELILSGA